jgi:hypothetical protein
VTIPREGGKFDEKPAVIAALDALGVPESAMKQTVDEALADLRKGLDPSRTDDQFTPEQILDKIAELRARGGKDPEEAKKELEAAKQAFQAQQDNTLLRAWEYSVASMAKLSEKEVEPYVESITWLGNKVIDVFCDVLCDEDCDEDEVADFASEVGTKFEELLKKKVVLRYDASAETELSSDGSSKRGLWVVHRQPDDSVVNDLGSQERLVKDLLAEAVKEVNQNDWATRLLTTDNSAFSEAKSPKKSGGAHTDELLACFYDNPEPVDVYKQKPKGGSELLAWRVEQNKALHDTSGEEIGRDTDGATFPLTGGPHAFSLKPGASKLRQLTEGVNDADGAQQAVAAYVDTQKQTRDTRLPLDLKAGSRVMRFVEKACAGMPQSWVNVIVAQLKKRPAEKGITPAELRKEIEDYFSQVRAPRLAKERQTQKAQSREDFANHVLADASPGAPTVPLNLTDGGPLMKLFDRALAACEPQDRQDLTAAARVRLKALGGTEVTLAKVKGVIDQVVKTDQKKRLIDKETQKVVDDLSGSLEKIEVNIKEPISVGVLEILIGTAFVGASNKDDLKKRTMQKLPGSNPVTLEQVRQAVAGVIEEERGTELDKALEDTRKKSEQALSGPFGK